MYSDVVTIATPGQLESVIQRRISRPEMRPDEVELEVDAVALSYKDVLVALGLVPPPAGGIPSLGLECVGRIQRIGAQVTGLSVGQEVIALGSGCLATTVCLPAETVRPKPRNIDKIDAVTLPVAFVTATYALEELARLRPGERVLIHCAAGGVGLAALQIAQQSGAQIFATAGSEEKREFLRRQGIEHVMDSRTPTFADELLSQTGGEGADVVLNSLSGVLLERSLAVLAPHGRFIELGIRDALEGRAIALSLFARGASFCAVGYLGALPRLGLRFADIIARAEIGEFRPLPKRLFPMAEAGAALSYLARARHIGKVVVVVRGEVAALSAAEPDDPTKDYLLPAEGAELFELILAARRPHVLVSKLPLESRLGGRANAPDSPMVISAKQPPLRRKDAPQAGRAEADAERPARPAASPRREPAGGREVAQRRHPRPALNVPFKAARNEAERQIAEQWAKYLGLESVGIHDDFFALGGDSLLAVQLAQALRNELRVPLPAHVLLENPNVADLARSLGQAPSVPDAAQRLVRLATGPVGERPLFLMHPVGGHVYFYVPLAQGLAPLLSVYGITAQGVDGEAPPLSSVEEMAQSYVAAIRRVQPQGPYRLGGSSFGGVLAFEMARLLLEAGESTDLLVMIDSPGPGAMPAGFRGDAEILSYLLSHGESSDAHLQNLSRMSDDDMLHYFLQQNGARERLPPDASIESIRHFLQLFRANFEALLAYRPRPLPIDGLLFEASEPDGINPVGLTEVWQPYFRRLESFTMPGNHITMNLPPNVASIIEQLRTALHST